MTGSPEQAMSWLLRRAWGHGAPVDPAVLAFRAKQLMMGKRSAWIYAVTFAGLISVFIIAHFARTLFHLTANRRGRIARGIAVPFRLYRRLFLRKIPKVTSGGHLLLIVVYFGLNAVVTFWDMDFKWPLSSFAKRCGWMAVCNTALAVLLAIKNNPLASLTGYSHERLNVLHRWVGRTIFVYSMLHVYIYVATYTIDKNTARFVEVPQIWGWVAFGAINIIWITGLQKFRRNFYEWFFVIHIVFFMLFIITLGMHKPLKFKQVMIAAGTIYIFDRVIRTIKTIYYSMNTTATLIPLPGLATKVVLNRKIHCQPGSHAFLNIPSLRFAQSHPFTISSASGTEFVIRAQKGFTLDLHKYALQHPNAQVKAIFDGPYGAVPDFRRFNKVVLACGGSGGAFAFPIAIDIVRNAPRTNVTHLDFVWVIKDRRQLTWYESEIFELKESPIVNLMIHVTSQNDTIATSAPTEEDAAVEQNVRNSMLLDDSGSISSDSEPSSPVLGLPSSQELRVHSEKKMTKAEKRRSVIDQQASPTIETLSGRPDLSAIVSEAVRDSEQTDTIAVGACGPVELMRVTRNAVAKGITISGPSVTLHCEQFGWG